MPSVLGQAREFCRTGSGDCVQHLIRAAATIADDDELIIVGSQAVLAQFPDAPNERCYRRGWLSTSAEPRFVRSAPLLPVTAGG